MKFNGKFEKGKFIPDSSRQKLWYRYLERIEREGVIVSIDVQKAERTSDSQLGLLFAIVGLVAKETGSNEEQVLEVIRKFRPLDGNFSPKRIDKLNTTEFKDFIDQSVIYLNSEFHLNIHLELLPDGKTNVKVC